MVIAPIYGAIYFLQWQSYSEGLLTPLCLWLFCTSRRKGKLFSFTNFSIMPNVDKGIPCFGPLSLSLYWLRAVKTFPQAPLKLFRGAKRSRAERPAVIRLASGYNFCGKFHWKPFTIVTKNVWAENCSNSLPHCAALRFVACTIVSACFPWFTCIHYPLALHSNEHRTVHILYAYMSVYMSWFSTNHGHSCLVGH